MVFPHAYNLGYSLGRKFQEVAAHTTLPPLEEVWTFLTTFPFIYKHWWLNLVRVDPVHVFVETTLLLSVVYMMVMRSKDWREDQKDKLTQREEEELLQEWKHHIRAPLAPTIDATDNPVVQQHHGRTVEITTEDGTTRTVLNFSSFDFLGIDNKESSKEALNRYGCGACGPRGFYGTIDVHLDLEAEISKVMQTEAAILYSDGASTCSSTVAAFAKRGDLLVVDEGVYEPLVTGIRLSRATVKWFRHNDMNDLRRVLEEVRATDQRLGRKPNVQRRFIVVEGLYKNSGTIVPLDELVALKHEFSYRLILDESFSFGTLGKTGKGVLELYNKQIMKDAEVVTIALENSLGSIGGVTVGDDEVVDHQRLSGAGYCFSAASPPFTASAAIQSLKQMQTRPELLERLNDNKAYLYNKLKQVVDDTVLRVSSDSRSPIVLLTTAAPEEASITEKIVQECLKEGLAVSFIGIQVTRHLRAELPPMIRMTVSAHHTKADIDQAVKIMREAAGTVARS